MLPFLADAEDQKYSDEITKHIEIVTIDETARQKEHHTLFSSRKHMNYTCEPCALGFVVEEAYHMHMKIHSEVSLFNKRKVYRLFNKFSHKVQILI